MHLGNIVSLPGILHDAFQVLGAPGISHDF